MTIEEHPLKPFLPYIIQCIKHNHMEKKTITRVQCLELNAMAERIAAGNG